MGKYKKKIKKIKKKRIIKHIKNKKSKNDHQKEQKIKNIKREKIILILTLTFIVLLIFGTNLFIYFNINNQVNNLNKKINKNISQLNSKINKIYKEQEKLKTFFENKIIKAKKNLSNEINEKNKNIEEKINEKMINLETKIKEKINRINDEIKKLNENITKIENLTVNKIKNLNTSLTNLEKNILIIKKQQILGLELNTLYQLLDIANQNYYTFNFDKAVNYYNKVIELSEEFKNEINIQRQNINYSSLNQYLKNKLYENLKIINETLKKIDQVAEKGKELNKNYFSLSDNEKEELINEINSLIDKIEENIKKINEFKKLTKLNKIDINRDSDSDGLKDWYELKIRSNPYQKSNEFTYLNEEIIKSGLSKKERQKVAFLLNNIGIDENDDLITKIWKIQNWISKNIKYDYDKLDDYTSINYPYTTYLKKKGVCTDYTIFTAALLLDSKISPVYLIEIEYNNEYYGHATVAIKYENKYYILDQILPIYSLENYYWYNIAIGNQISKIKMIEVVLDENKEIKINKTFEIDVKEISSNSNQEDYKRIFKLFNSFLEDEIEKKYNLQKNDNKIDFVEISGYYKYYNTQYSDIFKNKFIKYVFPRPTLKKYKEYFKTAKKYDYNSYYSCEKVHDIFNNSKELCTYYYSISLGI